MADYREMMDKMRREGQAERERVVRPPPSTAPKSFAKVNEPGAYEFGPGAYKGSGGYEYKVDSDGSVLITKSPRGAGGQKILPGAKFHDVIMADIEKTKKAEEELAGVEEAFPKITFEEEYIEGTLPAAKK